MEETLEQRIINTITNIEDANQYKLMEMLFEYIHRNFEKMKYLEDEVAQLKSDMESHISYHHRE